jgi:hypothetical protein
MHAPLSFFVPRAKSDKQTHNLSVLGKKNVSVSATLTFEL